MQPDQNTVNTITHILSGEMFRALGFSNDGWIARTFTPIIWNPIHRFAHIAAGFDQIVRVQGFHEASKWILPNFVDKVNVAGVASIPKDGPLIIAANHPGAFDTLVITANLSRSDVKIIVNIPLPFIQELPATQEHFLYAPRDPHIRIGVVRSALKHLKAGGVLLLFASGGIDPDPASMSGAKEALSNWSDSLDLFLKRVPQTKLQITLISGILPPKFVNHAFTHFRKQRSDKQRISEFFLVIRQMLSPGKYLSSPQLSFAEPLTQDQLLYSGMHHEIGPAIIQRAEEALYLHTATFLGHSNP
jgi:hypothetical protein